MPPNEKPKSEVQIMAEAIGEAIRANRPQGPLEQAGFSEAQIAQLTEHPKPKRWREVACKSDETGATFVACIVESRGMTNGRITQLKNYTHPKGAAVFTSAGGLVPDNLQILRAGTTPPVEGAVLAKHDLTPYYLQWRWETFLQADLRRYVGKEIQRYLAVDEAAFTTPWKEGHVRVNLVDETAA